VLVPLAATPYKLFDLDRFFLPKELVLHVCAALCAALCLARRDAASPDRPTRTAPGATWVDLALIGYLALSLASTLTAPNPWLATRALAITLSGAALFWTARHLAGRGLGDTVVGAAGAACALAAAMTLLQAYGVETEYFSLNRAPGGTFGNRNFVAHLAAVGGPLLVFTVLRARSALPMLGAAAGLVATAAALVLSRSRGAYLATAASMVPLVLGAWRAARLPGAAFPAGRALLVAAALGAGAAGAVTLPNTLEWKSDNPYLESVKGVVDYKSGSGRGRLKQYTNSVRMTVAHPLLGVGAGNWPVRYPRYAPAGDPSLGDDGMTSNPWPSSDWVAVLSERGPVALAALGAVFLGLALWAHAAVWRGRSAEGAMAGGVLGAALAAAVVVGTFDAVLLLAAPAFVVWTALGALAGLSGAADDARRVVAAPRPVRRLGALAVALVLLASALRTVGQAVAMALFSTGRAPQIAMAARLDPGSFRVRVREAELAARRGRCTEVRTHAGAAHDLFPEAGAPRRLLAACGTGTRRRSR